MGLWALPLPGRRCSAVMRRLRRLQHGGQAAGPRRGGRQALGKAAHSRPVQTWGDGLQSRAWARAVPGTGGHGDTALRPGLRQVEAVCHLPGPTCVLGPFLQAP